MSIPKVDILGVNVSRLDIPGALAEVSRIIDRGEKAFIAVPNVFVLTECKRNSEYREIINSASLVFPDGLPLVWASYLLGQYTGGRVCGPDFFTAFHRTAVERKYSNYYLGGGPGGSEKVVSRLRDRYPDLLIAGNFSPPMGTLSDNLNEAILQRIKATKPDILWVGMGAPRQERWISRYLDRLDVRIAIGVGAVFYYEAGIKKRAPRWMQRIGMEWSYRILKQEPSLFWRKRYYAYLWEFIIPVLSQVLVTRLGGRKEKTS
jgi:N-acetylglucosaminyldiphosphoundecaprenol N-acetyl-beta-D-mannosaminyltransferase